VSMSSLGRLAALASAMTLAATVLSSCGSASPGVAAQVGDDTITTSQVDELAADVCTLQKALPKGGPNEQQPTSGLVARDGALQSLILRSIGEQMAADHGVSADSDYEAQVHQTRLQFGTVDDETVEAALPAYTSVAYFVNIMRQIGKSTGASNDDEALTAGIKQAQSWQSDHPIETNPMFGSFSIGDQEIESERDDLAFPVSKTAKDAESGSADYYASLPASQRCG